MNRDLAYILDKVVFLGIFLLPFLPLIVTTGFFFPYITGKAFFFRFLVQVMFVCWAILAIYDKKYRPAIGWLFLTVLGWLLVTILAGVFGVDPFRSFYSNFERMEGVVTYLHLTAYFVVLVSVMQTDRLWRYLFQTSVVASILVAMYGFGQLFGWFNIMQGGSRLESTLGNAAYLAFYASLHIFLLAWLWLGEKNNQIKLFYVLVGLLQLFIVYKTATRGAVLGLLAGAGLMTLLSALFYRHHRQVRLWSLVSLVTIAVMVGGFWSARDLPAIRDHQVLGRFASISFEEQTTRSRFMVWQMAIDGALERPVLGYGPGNFRYVFNANYNPRMYDQEQWFDRSHNLIFDWLTSTGVIGLALYLLMLVLALGLLWRRSEFSFWQKNIITGFLVAYLVQVIFVFDNIVTYYLLFTILAFIYSQSIEQARRFEIFRGLSGLADSVAGRQVMASLVVIALLPAIYLFVLKPMMAAGHLVAGMKEVNNNPVTALESFRRVIDYNTTGRTEAREQLTMASIRVLGNESLDESTRQQFGEFVYNQWQAQIMETPNDARVYLFFGSFLNATGRFDEAIVSFERALELSPDKQSILFELAGAHANKGDMEKALEVTEYAFALTPDNPEGRIFYAVMLISAGQIELAEELLLEGFDTLAVDNDRLLNAYVAQGRFEVVEEIWQKRVARNPNNLQTWFSYAASFIVRDQIEEAVAVLEEAKEFLPDQITELEQAIVEVRAGRVQVN